MRLAAIPSLMALRTFLAAVTAAAFLGAAVGAHAAIPVAERATAVEYYHAGLDHYFVTAAQGEIGDLDTGVHPGWVRTGYRFPVMKPASAYGGTSPVCRFYNPGHSTHFYSAKPAECDDVKVKYPAQWTFEADEVYRAFLVDPASGACPVDTQPVYRLYNNRADPNHRYTTQIGVLLYMKGQGYIPEGDGNPALPVAYCAPTGGDTVPPGKPGAPTCTVTASNPSPTPGSSITLTANCANGATSYWWTGCTSMQATCVATRASVGSVVYTVDAANAVGPAAPASTSVTWSSGPPPSSTTPKCSIETTPRFPAVNTSLVLKAVCTPSATTYQWTACPVGSPNNCAAPPGCTSSSDTCNVTSSSYGNAGYIVQGTNSVGTGPWVQVIVEWQDNPATRPGFCGQYDRVKHFGIPWGSIVRYTTAQYGGFTPETVFVMEMTVPFAPTSYAGGGNTSLAEYNGPPAPRHMTLSKTPCDFRAPDVTGVNGPLAASSGTVVFVGWNVNAAPLALVPGQTYYFSFRNLSCGQDSCEASTTTNWPH